MSVLQIIFNFFHFIITLKEKAQLMLIGPSGSVNEQKAIAYESWDGSQLTGWNTNYVANDEDCCIEIESDCESEYGRDDETDDESCDESDNECYESKTKNIFFLLKFSID